MARTSSCFPVMSSRCRGFSMPRCTAYACDQAVPRGFPGTDSRRVSRGLRTGIRIPFGYDSFEKDTITAKPCGCQIAPLPALHRLCYKRAAVDKVLKWGANHPRIRGREESGSGPANLAGVPVASTGYEDASRFWPSLLASD